MTRRFDGELRHLLLRAYRYWDFPNEFRWVTYEEGRARMGERVLAILN